MKENDTFKRVEAVLAVTWALTLNSMAGYWSGGYYMSNDGKNRYSLSGGAEYYVTLTSTWVKDLAYSSNPAYMEFIAAYGSSYSTTYRTVDSYNQAGLTAQNTTYTTIRLSRQYYLYNPDYYAPSSGSGSSGSGGSSGSYEESAIPEWDFITSAGLSYTRSKFHLGAGGVRQNTQITTLSLEGAAIRDRLSLIGQIRAENQEGGSSGTGIDGRTAGLLLMPEYLLLQQEENGVNFGVFGALDLSMAIRESIDDQQRVMPAVGSQISRMTRVGLFQAAYSFAHSRNVNGDTELTGGKYIDFHNVTAEWAVPLTSSLYSAIGMNYQYALDLPRAMEKEFTSTYVELGTNLDSHWSFGGGVSWSVDGNDSLGLRVGASYLW